MLSTRLFFQARCQCRLIRFILSTKSSSWGSRSQDRGTEKIDIKKFLIYLWRCEQIGRFLQVLGNKLSHKSSSNILVTFWTIPKNVTLLCKKCVATFWANFGGNWATFYSIIWSHGSFGFQENADSNFLLLFCKIIPLTLLRFPIPILWTLCL